MSVCSKETLIGINELPIFNGIRISAIYAQKRDENFYRVRDAYGDETPDFYLLVPYFWTSNKNQYVKTLPESLLKVFGKQTYNDKTTYVTHITYRTSDSSNGSFIDESIYLKGGNFGISFYRGLDDKYGVNGNSELGKNILGTLNVKIDVPHCEEWEYTFYPCSFIRREGGFNYPDVACSGWRWLYGENPYISNEFGKRNNIRVWDDEYNAHLYLQRVTSVNDGDENLIVVEFSRYRDKKPDQFCTIQKWANTKKGAENEIIRFNAKMIKNEIRLVPIVNGVEQNFNRPCYLEDVYRIMSITRI